MSSHQAALGARVRAAREARGLSLSALAAAAGVGKATLSQIESGSRNPTLDTLYRLVEQVGVPLSALLDERVGTVVADAGMTATLLDARRDDAGVVDVFRLVFEPGCRRESPSHGRGVVEHLVVVRGTLEVGVGDERHRASEGQSLTWVSDRPHRYATRDGAEAVLVITTPVTTPATPASSPPA